MGLSKTLAFLGCILPIGSACVGAQYYPETGAKQTGEALPEERQPQESDELALTPEPVTVLLGATIFDSTGSDPIEDGVVLIEKDRIVAVGPRSEIEVPKDAFVIDAKGKWIVPGLIDAHIHFFQSAGIYTRPHIIDLRDARSYEQEVATIKANLNDTFRRYLVSGVTAVVDMGGPFWNFEVRDKARETVLAPRVAVAGPLVSTIARPRLDIGDPPIIKAETPDEARALVKKQLQKKPDLVKIWFIASPEFSPDRGLEQTADIMRAAVDEAHKGGVRVAVHATEVESARASVKAGAEILVHSIHDAPMDDALVQLLKEKSVILIPTLGVLEGYVETLGQAAKVTDIEERYGDPKTMLSWQELEKITGPPPKEADKRREKNEKRMPIMVKNLMKLQRAGVTIAAGTDAGNIGTLHGPSFHHELELMVQAGMDAKSILLAATRNAAKVFSKDPEIGTLEKGKFADLLVLDADPLAAIGNLQKINKVIKGGVVLEPGQILPPNSAWVVQKQVDAYNARDIDSFLSFYADDAALYEHQTGKALASGKEQLRKIYKKLFDSSPKLNCRILSRMVQGNMVVDHELVTGIDKRPYLHGVAIYEVKNGLIQKVWFLPREE